MGASASREKFQESVSALIDVDVSPDDAEFWDELWKIPSSTEEVFELISPESARKLRDERFDNLATLFTQATAQLCQIVETPYSIYFDQALNCVRVLTRVLPFLLEKGDLGESDENVENLCWSTGGGANDDDSEDQDSILGKLIGDEEDGQTRNKNVLDEGGDQEPLALLVVHAAMHMLFLPQFTCDFQEDQPHDDEHEDSDEDSDEDSHDSIEKQKKKKPVIDGPDPEEEGMTEEQIEIKRKNEAFQLKEDHAMKAEAGLAKVKVVENGVLLIPKPSSIVWAPGCGVQAKQLVETNARKFDKNRVEVLRLLLAACCDPLFSPADEYNPLASRWLAVAVAADAPNAICLFYSLLNTIISYEPSQSYTGAFTVDSHAKLVSLSAQVLCALLDCGLSANPEVVLNEDEEPVADFEDASKAGFNIFRLLLARINSGKELTIIYHGFCRLMRHVYQGKNTLLKSKKGLACHQEILILFWKMLEENPLFMDWVLTKCDATEIVTPICYLMYEARKDPAQIGLVHICTFILLKLSGERSFAVGLNKPFGTKLPCDIPLFSGGHSDLVSITLHKLIVNGTHKFVPLYSCFLTIICNISPYWRSMSLVAAVKLVNLYELFSSPKFLYSGEKSHRHLALLLEVFNNVIQYQYNGNQHLIYAIIRRKDSFGRLATLNLTKAVAQCKKVYEDNGAMETIDKTNKVVSMRSTDHEGNTKKENDDDSDSSSVVGDHFLPTEEWISELKEVLPFETLTRLLQHLVPVVDEIVSRQDGVIDEGEILDILKDITMVGLLPVPHAIVIRKYQPNQFTALWFTAYLWGVIFVGNQSLPIFDGQAIELFQVALDEDEADDTMTKTPSTFG